MSFLVRVSWPEDDGHLAQMPDGSVGIAPRGDGRPLAQGGGRRAETVGGDTSERRAPGGAGGNHVQKRVVRPNAGRGVLVGGE